MEKRFKNFVTSLTILVTLALTVFSVSDTIGQIRPVMYSVPDTVMKQIALDILALELLTAQQDSTIIDLRSSLQEMKKAHSSMVLLLDEEKYKREVLSLWIQKERERTEIWRSRAIKYKRQRNGIIVGAVVVAGGFFAVALSN